MADTAPCIYVLAGTNGAGKSSVLGEILLEEGTRYFNPDVATAKILAANPGMSLNDANGVAWTKGKTFLESAIREKKSFAFETTLGGKTITHLLEQALVAGLEVRMWYVGLATPELHLERVRSRVSYGGHDIPEERIRERFAQSRLNLMRLLPRLTELRVYDNSADADPKTGHRPRPELLLHCAEGSRTYSCKPAAAPGWIKAILTVAFKLKE